MARERAQFLFRFQEGGRWGTPHDLVNDRYSIGRGYQDQPNAVDFVVPTDVALSRLHCYLVGTGDGYVVQNESKNGTYVNGKLIRGRRRLKHQDRIEVGASTVMQFLAVSADERKRLLSTDGALAEDDAEAPPPSADAASGGGKTSKAIYYVLGFYAFFGLLIFALLNVGDPRVKDPGTGPYLEYLWAESVAPMVPAPTKDDPDPQPVLLGRKKVEELWWAAKKSRGWDDQKHGRVWDKVREPPQTGLIDVAGNRWALIHEAMRLLRRDGRYPRFKEAYEARDPIAGDLWRLREQLEPKLTERYDEAKQFDERGHKPRAIQAYREIVEELPDRTHPLHRFAVQRIEKLQEDD